ncbi:DUF3667 domain-containing protein [Xanthomonas phaseoli]|uniref:DUF3667 domain-containing protein n=2 Tax=Xanthomonas TaxID=338 RepID=A0A8I1XN59_XANMN|nr:DUF3667 domain-containing protein [Xanthomonas phaseoli]RWU14348.1 DUF3667 domain-containing protein [Xanthomonas phaseoli pv. manihotis str. CIO151]KUF23616.1 hypothetical protein AO826_12250 [Xanthomonas phaseoli pv. manihotis]MBO9720562.1 DUF3667 domain-containing protein [Xanthomonas phaseoli pv. manihotis]MBO9756436.1 DUF3667 domain-containing protein [Xanthomonas phaseoli pv. manihotis]MBO9760142.1 DUF3667 domain-containing protein [Xanthomonas phaseoli pv. manihotis]
MHACAKRRSFGIRWTATRLPRLANRNWLMSPHSTAHHPTACENCATALQGAYCHACGQSAHNPVRSVAHAVEEVFESFWHLDGRIFRTLRDLLVPGRVAQRFLGGQRVRYVAPMRLFLVLSLLTFFIARIAVHASDADSDSAAAPGTSQTTVPKDFAHARTPAQVEAVRRQLVETLTQTRAAVPSGIARDGMDAGIARANAQAQRRLTQLQADARPTSAVPTAEANSDSTFFSVMGKPWDPVSNPLHYAALPQFANRWINTQLRHIRDNLPRLRSDPQLLYNAFFAAVPSALLVLVPLFALLLRVFYVRSGQVYLEHLVVALYSHAFLCLNLLTQLLLSLLSDALAHIASPITWSIGVVQFGLTLWMPVYLLWMQRRVYAQSWLVTVLKYIGQSGVYLVLVTVAAALLMVASLARL